MVSTHLFEQARDIVLEYLGLNGGLVHTDKYVVIFCSPRRTELLKAQLGPAVIKLCQARTSTCHWVYKRVLAVDRKALPGGAPFQTGEGTTSRVSLSWVICTNTPDKFEASTPGIVKVIF